MKVQETLTLNGHSNPGTMATRLRDLADGLDELDQAMQDLGSAPPSIPGGNNLVFTFQVEGNLP